MKDIGGMHSFECRGDKTLPSTSGAILTVSIVDFLLISSNVGQYSLRSYDGAAPDGDMGYLACIMFARLFITRETQIGHPNFAINIF